jgi:hypothetical protein
MLVTLMITSCLCAGSRESTFRSCLPYWWPRHDYVMSVYWPRESDSDHFAHVGDPDMIMPCLCAGSRECTFRSCLPYWWPQHDYVLSVYWPRESDSDHFAHVGDPDMIMPCLFAGSKESTFRSCVDPDMILSCLCAGPSTFGSCLPCWWPQYEYVLSEIIKLIGV